MKSEYKIIANIIEANTRVLDVGCNDGTLMEFLKTNKNIDIRGIEISKEQVQTCVSKGLTVVPKMLLNVCPPIPNSGVLVFPMIISPAFLILVTIGLSVLGI